ncbi:hypothetical protein Caka_0269 [Coraliomargarita akajimensis DSM 45221]|uniref:Uncharacterized protein n=1 Tax=Coraliomargarita akajimensis (strain DSM 45221 / IAM 15411 / JCM 23193 / KCTC 12865 / 04OKA010-24) TaxID=583355 RepID=D5ELX0_CORAD|nr:hypothetical protein Caka_0269 [Coraliomargarita akajimensis DSM 45221]
MQCLIRFKLIDCWLACNPNCACGLRQLRIVWWLNRIGTLALACTHIGCVAVLSVAAPGENTAGDSRGDNWANLKDVAAPVPRGVGWRKKKALP